MTTGLGGEININSSKTAPNKGSPEYIFEQMNQLIRVLEAQQREIMELKMRNNIIDYRLDALERKMNAGM